MEEELGLKASTETKNKEIFASGPTDSFSPELSAVEQREALRMKEGERLWQYVGESPENVEQVGLEFRFLSYIYM